MKEFLITEEEYLKTFNYPHNKFFIKKALERMKKWNLIPLKTSDRRLPFLSLISGWLIGDGILTKNDLCFFDEDTKSLEILKNGFEKTFPSIPIIGPVEEKRERGVSCILKIEDFSMAHLFKSLDIPARNKLKIKFGIPKIALINKETVRMFLSGILGSEMRTPVLDPFRKFSICPVWFGMSKHPEYEYSHMEFLNKIHLLLSKFGIDTSEIKKKVSKRKNEQPQYGFYIRKNIENILKFYFEIPLTPFKTKNEKFQRTIKKIIKHYSILNKELEKYERVKQLSKIGLSTRKISKIISVPKSTVWRWSKSKTRYLKRIEKIKLLIRRYKIMEMSHYF